MRILAVVMMMLLCGCITNNYEEFYVDMSEQGYGSAKKQVKQLVELRAVTTEDEVIDILEDGYVAIGRSSFSSAYTPYSCAIDTAEKHGATLVLLDVRYKESKQYTSVMFLPSYSTSHTFGTSSATVYSGGQFATAHGNYSGVTTTTTMNVVPVQRSCDIYLHDALFLKKSPSLGSYGVIWHVPQRLPGEDADAPITVMIQGVLHGSRAEKEGLCRGQIVARVNGSDIKTRKDIQPYVNDPSRITKVEVVK